MLEYADRLLTEFVNRYDVLYGDKFTSCTLYLLLHLKETVRDFGPLWTSSCFPFEDINGKLKCFVHSSRHPELQICSAISMLLSMSILRHNNLVPNTPPYEYCNQLSKAKKKMMLTPLSERISSVGKCNDTILLPEIVEQALTSAAI